MRSDDTKALCVVHRDEQPRLNLTFFHLVEIRRNSRNFEPSPTTQLVTSIPISFTFYAHQRAKHKRAGLGAASKVSILDRARPASLTALATLPFATGRCE